MKPELVHATRAAKRLCKALAPAVEVGLTGVKEDVRLGAVERGMGVIVQSAPMCVRLVVYGPPAPVEIARVKATGLQNEEAAELSAACDEVVAGTLADLDSEAAALVAIGESARPGQAFVILLDVLSGTVEVRLPKKGRPFGEGLSLGGIVTEPAAGKVGGH